MGSPVILKALNLQPEWEFPTYRFWVHLDDEKLHESGLPDMTFVQSFDFSTAPPNVRSDGFTGEQILGFLDEAIKARRFDLVKDGLITGGKADADAAALAQEPARINPQRLEWEAEQARIAAEEAAAAAAAAAEEAAETQDAATK